MRRCGFSLLTVALMALAFALVSPAHAIMLVSRSQEVAVGKQVQADMIREYGGLNSDPKLAGRVGKIGASVAAVSPRRDVQYTYQVLNSDIINAFAAPGGPIMITRALAKMLTDDELAFVLAHETGHVAAQHGRDAINRGMLAQGIAGLMFGKSSGAVQMGVNITYTLYSRGYSRSQEYEADSYGVRLMTKAGYKPEACVRALAKLGVKRTDGINKYLSTHPDIPDRITRVTHQANITPQRTQQIVDEVTSK